MDTVTQTAKPLLKEHGVHRPIRSLKDLELEARSVLDEGSRYTRENPKAMALSAVGVGFLLAQLPIRSITGGFLRLALLVLKPTLLLLGLVKLSEEWKEREHVTQEAE